jgi:hypothetical protein
MKQNRRINFNGQIVCYSCKRSGYYIKNCSEKKKEKMIIIERKRELIEPKEKAIVGISLKLLLRSK